MLLHICPLLAPHGEEERHEGGQGPWSGGVGDTMRTWLINVSRFTNWLILT